MTKTNEEIAKEYFDTKENYLDLMWLARQEERKRILEILKDDPYPLDVFPELSGHEIENIKLDFPLARLSAYVGRRIRAGLIEQIKDDDLK